MSRVVHYVRFEVMLWHYRWRLCSPACAAKNEQSLSTPAMAYTPTLIVFVAMLRRCRVTRSAGMRDYQVLTCRGLKEVMRCDAMRCRHLYYLCNICKGHSPRSTFWCIVQVWKRASILGGGSEDGPKERTGSGNIVGTWDVLAHQTCCKRDEERDQREQREYT